MPRPQETGDSPHEYIYDLLMHGDLEFDGDPDDSWLMAAADANILDLHSRMGGLHFGKHPSRTRDRFIDIISRHRVEWVTSMQALADWYREDDSPTGILQVGGGIAGDFLYV